MGFLDATTWQAVGVTLTLVGLLLSVLVWRRRGAVTGLRAVGWSLLPAAAGLTGTLRLLWGIGSDIVAWAVRLVFSPVVWVGVATAGLSLALFAVSAGLGRRAAGRATTGSGRPQAKSTGPGTSTPGLPGAGSGARARPAVQDEDMDDIEAILRRHGIS